MTEADAKTKWCPFARDVAATETGAASFNRPFGVHANGMTYAANETCHCIGSACMARRELHPRAEREDHSGASGFMADIAIKTNRIVRREGGPGCTGHLILDATGFCGLAVKP